MREKTLNAYLKILNYKFDQFLDRFTKQNSNKILNMQLNTWIFSSMICIISSKVYFFRSDDLRAIVASEVLLIVLAEVPRSKAFVLLITKLSFSIAYSKVKLNDRSLGIKFFIMFCQSLC